MNKSLAIPEAEQVGGLALPDIKIYSKIIGSVWLWGSSRQVEPSNRTKNQALTVWYMTEVALQITGERRDRLISGAGTIGYPYGQTNWISTLYCRRDQCQRDERLKCERQSFKLREHLYDLRVKENCYKHEKHKPSRKRSVPFTTLKITFVHS